MLISLFLFFSCNFVSFCLLCFEVLYLGTYISFISSWYVDPSWNISYMNFIMKCSSWFLIMFLVLKSVLPDIKILPYQSGCLLFLWLLFAWYIFSPFTFNLFVVLNLSCFSFRWIIVGTYFFIQSNHLWLLIGIFMPFKFHYNYFYGWIYIWHFALCFLYDSCLLSSSVSFKLTSLY